MILCGTEEPPLRLYEARLLLLGSSGAISTVRLTNCPVLPAPCPFPVGMWGSRCVCLSQVLLFSLAPCSVPCGWLGLVVSTLALRCVS